MRTKSILLISTVFASQVLGGVISDVLNKFSGKEECDGSAEVSKQADLESIKTCKKITGDLIIHASETDYKVDLPKLEKIGGTLKITGNRVTEIKLSDLKKIGKEFSIKDATKLTKLDIHKLKDVHAINFDSVKVAQNLVFKDLKVATKITFLNTDFLELTGLKYKTNTGDLTISKNSKLTRVSIEELDEVDGDFILENNTALRGVLMPTLKTIKGSLKIKGNSEIREFKLTALNDVKAVEIDSRYLHDLDLGTYTLKETDVIKAPVDCAAYTTKIKSFKKDECEALKKALPAEPKSSAMSLKQSSLTALSIAAVAYVAL